MDANRLETLERRVTALEDEVAILRLVASYGPLVDTGKTDLAPELFTESGVYDVSYGHLNVQAFQELLAGNEHQTVVREGIAHVMGLPYIRIDGDKALVINATQLYKRDGDGYTIFRIAQNVWKLVRTTQGWKIQERVNRLIGNNDEARALLESAVINE